MVLTAVFLSAAASSSFAVTEKEAGAFLELCAHGSLSQVTKALEEGTDELMKVKGGAGQTPLMCAARDNGGNTVLDCLEENEALKRTSRSDQSSRALREGPVE